MFARHNRLIGIIFLLGDVLLALASLGLAQEIRSHLGSLRPLFSLTNYPGIISLASAILLFAVTFALNLEFVSRLLLGIYALMDFLLMVIFRLVAWRFAEPL